MGVCVVKVTRSKETCLELEVNHSKKKERLLERADNIL